MVKYTTKYFVSIFYLLVLSVSVSGQFYNGLQMNFGKNRIQYGEFYWQYYRFDRFDTYFNEYGKDLALYTEWYATQEIKRLESLLDYTLERRIIFLIFNKLTDFRQSNIGLVTGADDYNIGGVTQISNNKVSLFYEGDHIKFQKQITAAIAQIIINEMLYGNQLRENMTNSMLIGLPSWFSKGLISYLSENWSPEIEDYVKDGILSRRYKKFNKLTGTDALYAGHSFWRYIEKTYGQSVIPNIIYLIQVNKNVKDGFLYVLGANIKSVKRDWYQYYTDKFSGYKAPPENTGTAILKRPRKNWVYNNVRTSPDGMYISYVTNILGQYKLWVYNTERKQKRRLLKKEHRIDQIPDYSFPIMAWHPNGKVLTYITEEKGGLKLSFYNVETREIVTRNLLYFEKVLDFSYSQDGTKLVMSAMKLGKTDIYVHNLASATDDQITRDLADDLTPRFIDNSKKIIFSSNRLSDSLKTMQNENMELSPYFQLYIVPYPVSTKKLIQISPNSYTNHTQPFEIGQNRFIYLGDDNGIINRYLAEYDSTISFIDTTVHYRYFTKSFPVTNYNRNILQHDLSKKQSKLGMILFNKDKYYIYQNDITKNAEQVKIENTEYRNEIIKSINKQLETDSIKKQKALIALKLPVPIPVKDTTKIKKTLPQKEIDINHYVFEIEKPSGNKEMKLAGGISVRKNAEGDLVNPEDEKQVRIYLPAFYINTLVNQVDFSFLNASYQPFNGGAGYYTPGFNVNLKLGTNDLFDDYKITGGIRFGVDFDSNEYLLSFENLKKRIDKQVIFHRVAYKSVIDDGYSYVKTTTQEGYYLVRYPFNQVFSARITASVRYDKTSFLAIERTSLNKPNIYDVWAGAKGELIFDNSRKLNVNIYSGTRAKIFAEAYKQVNLKKSDLFVLGADYRHYLVLHRNLILANRVAASTSFGGSRLIYYLGSVDNWINFSSKIPTFDNTIRIDDQGKYAFQALATNMRGFSQNIRNGNNFMVMNNELRWPFITYFSRSPVSSAFWNSLQAIAFFDAGTAWTGWDPFSGNNAYDYDEVQIPETYPRLTIRVDTNRGPIVYGYGYGLRAQILGYFIRFDWAWGIENNVKLPKVFYLSFSTDF